MVCFTARFSTRQINPFQFSPACTSTSLNKQNLCIVSRTFFTSAPNHIVIASHSTCFIRNIVGFWNCSHNMKLTLLCRSSEAWSSFAFAPKMPWKAYTVQCCSIHPDPIRSLKSSPTDWDISVLLSNLCWTGSGLKRIHNMTTEVQEMLPSQMLVDGIRPNIPLQSRWMGFFNATTALARIAMESCTLQCSMYMTLIISNYIAAYLYNVGILHLFTRSLRAEANCS